MSHEHFLLAMKAPSPQHHDCRGQKMAEQRLMQENKGQSTWNEFLQALHAPGDHDFNAFYWIFRIAIALLDTIIPCRNHDRRQMFNVLLSWFRPVVPFVGMTIVLFCGWSYFSVFRYTVVRTKWCGANTEEFVSQSTEASCQWEKVHGLFVAFFIINIIGHYLRCTFGSPGFVQATFHNQNTSFEFNNASRQSSEIIYHPNPNQTYCDKCGITRPARVHHCRICKKCIELYDHHCPWTNNCIGRDNYRSFVLLVFYILAGCIYGVCMLGRDFCIIMKQRSEVYGWSLRGAEHGTGLLDLPLPWVLWRSYEENGHIDTDVVLRAAFPLMFFVGIVMWWFLGYHIRIIMSGFTTLEDMSRPRLQYLNTFDRGPRENLKQVFGSNWFKLFVPLPQQRLLPHDASELKKQP
jgi:hypothetical protein